MKPRLWLSTLASRYWPLIKSLQTGLLLATGLAGFMSARCPVIYWSTLLGLSGSLFLAIAGSTILNMWYDRDIDAQMRRTCTRPLASGALLPSEALRLGLLLSLAGILLSLALSPLYGAVVFLGWFFDVVVYTLWLKRRTAWAILWGGIAGGMPVLAGRVLGLGRIDWIGAALALAVLFWIPTHILTFSLRYENDYRRAGIPTFPQRYGRKATRLTIAFSSMLVGFSMGAAALGIEINGGFLHLLGLISGGLLLLAVYSLWRPSERTNFALFKYASFYMLISMILISLATL